MDRRFTILIAEDDPRVRDGVVALLREHGFVVLVAEDGDAALRLLVAHEVDLLLTDVAMPGINGFETAQQAKSMRPGLRLLCMRGYAEEARTKAFSTARSFKSPSEPASFLRRLPKLSRAEPDRFVHRAPTPRLTGPGVRTTVDGRHRSMLNPTCLCVRRKRGTHVHENQPMARLAYR